MTVLKKFGCFLIFLLIIGATSLFAQTTECCTTQSTEKKSKPDPLDFVHNQVLKASASNPVEEFVPQATGSKSKSAIKTQKAKTGNTYTKSTLPSQSIKGNHANEKEKLAIEKSTEAAVAQDMISAAISEDLAARRTITKTVQPKEESSFSNVMMDWIKDKYSCMIDVMPNQISNVMLYRFIDEWYGVKYRMGGETKSGIDCSAFVQNLYRYVFGLDLLRTACSQFEEAQRIKDPSELKEGDLVFFKVKSSRISHVGVYLRNNFFVHSASSKGVSIASLTSNYWSKYFVGGGRIQR
jgi:hypothetical protein